MSKKLVVRINNLPDEPDSATEVTEEVVYHWDRILSVGVVVALVVALLAWIWVQWSISSSPLEESVGDTHSATVVATLSEPLEPESVAGESEHETAPLQDKPEPTANDQTASQPTDASDSATAMAKGESDSVSDASDVVAVPVSNPASVEPRKDITAAFVDPVVIHDDRIARAQITHQIINREPVEKLGHTIAMSEAGIIRVYLFTEMQNLKGETVYHDWYLGDKRMARVTLNVRYDRTRASSSKYINRQMAGDWRVMVTNRAGDLLVSAQFNVPQS